jgi:excisionase family DNA binding protein
MELRVETKRLLTLKEVERRLSLSRWTLYEFIRRGTLPAVKLPSGHYRVPEDAVDAFAANMERR